MIVFLPADVVRALVAQRRRLIDVDPNHRIYSDGSSSSADHEYSVLARASALALSYCACCGINGATSRDRVRALCSGCAGDPATAYADCRHGRPAGH